MTNLTAVQGLPPVPPHAARMPSAPALTRSRPMLRRWATWLFGRADAADALVDDVLDEAARDLAFLADATAVRADLFDRFTRLAVARLRDRARLTPLYDDSDEPGEDGEPVFHPDGRWCDAPAAWHDDDGAAAPGLHAALERGIDALPRQTACVFVLREVFGLTAREIAALVRLPLPVCRTMLCRARLRLQQRLQREWAAARRVQ